MNSEKNAAQTTEDITSEVGENAAPDKENVSGADTKSDVSDVNFTDGTADDGNSGKTEDEGDGTVGKKKAAKGVKSSEYAEKRRWAERQRAIKDAEVKATIRALGGINPYTGENMTDGDDVDEFLAMQEIKNSGGDPVTDYMKHIKERARKRAADAAKAEEAKERMQTELEDIRISYPSLDVEALINDEMFDSYADGKVGRIPLKKIYEDFLGFSAGLEKRASDRAAQIVANAKASPGSLASGGEPTGEFFTREQVKAMSQAEVGKNYEKIIKSMKKW